MISIISDSILGQLYIKSTLVKNSNSVVLAKRPRLDIFEYHSEYLPLSCTNPQEYCFELGEMFSKISQPRAVYDLGTLNNSGQFNLLNDDEIYIDQSDKLTFHKDGFEVEYSIYENGQHGLSITLKLDYIAVGEYISSKLIRIRTFEGIEKPLFVIKSVNYPNISISFHNELIDLPRLLQDIDFDECNIWQFTMQSGSFEYPVLACECNTHYIVVNEKNYQIFVDPNNHMHLSFNGGAHQINISVIGSCFARQVFNSISFFNPTYKSRYHVQNTAFHQSIISMMSKSVFVDVNDLSYPVSEKTQYPDLVQRYGMQEFSKSYLKSLKTLGVDFVILDLFIESTESVLELDSDRYLTDAITIKNTIAYNKLNIKQTLRNDNPIRFKLFEKYVIQFRKEIEKILPLDHVILIKVRHALEYESDGQVAEFKGNKWSILSNELWGEYEKILLRCIPEIQVIDCTQKQYIATTKNPLNLSPNHLISEYYSDVLHELDRIVLETLVRERRLDR